MQSLYAHLSTGSFSNLKEGQFVAQGQQIALSGNTGNSTGPHLHLEMKLNGSNVNPQNYLTKTNSNSGSNPGTTPSTPALPATKTHLDTPTGTYDTYNHIELKGWIACNEKPSYIMAEIPGIQQWVTNFYKSEEQVSGYAHVMRFSTVIDKNLLAPGQTYEVRVWSSVSSPSTFSFSTGANFKPADGSTTPPASTSGKTMTHLDTPTGTYNTYNHIELKGWIACNEKPGFIMAEIPGLKQWSMEFYDSTSESVAGYAYLMRFSTVIDKTLLAPGETYEVRVWSSVSDLETFSFSTGADFKADAAATPTPPSNPGKAKTHLDTPSGTYSTYNHIELKGWLACNEKPGYIMAEIPGLQQWVMDFYESTEKVEGYTYVMRFSTVIDANLLTAGKTYQVNVWSNVSDAAAFTFKTGSDYVPKTYSITYDANGGTNAPEAQIKKQLAPLAITSDIPTRENYTFLGWAAEATATEAAYRPADTYTANAAITLYAVWQQNRTLTEISIDTLPTNTTFYAGEWLDCDGLVIALTYSDSTTETITMGYTVEYDFSTPGAETVLVSYGGKTTSFEVTVKAPEPESDENAPSILVSDARGMAGDTVSVTASLKNNPGFSGLNVYLTYAEGLTLLEASNATELTFTSDRTMLWDSASDYTEDGELLRLQFRIDDTAEVGDYFVKVNFIEAYTAELENVTFASVGGTVHVLDFVYGDADGDGTVNTKDVILIRRHVAAKDPTTGQSTVSVYSGADADGDGTVNTKDIILVRRHVAAKDPITGESSVVLGPGQ